MKKILLALALLPTPAFAAIDFFWRAEGTTLNGTDDFSQGDTTADPNQDVSISATAGMVGTNGILVTAPSSSSYYEFDADIADFAGSPSTQPMSAGFIVNFRTALPQNGDIIGLEFKGTGANDRVLVSLASTNEINLRVHQQGQSAINLNTSAANVAANTQYRIIIRLDLANDDRNIEVYNSSCTLIEDREDTSTDLSLGIPTDITSVQIAKTSADANNTWYDNYLIENTYAGVTCAELSNDSYTDFAGAAATFTSGPAQVAVTTTTVQVSFTSDTTGTVEGVACANGSGTPSAAEVLADQCSGGGAAPAHFDEAVVATVSDGATFTGLLPGTTYDTFYVIDAAVDSTVASLADQTTTATAFTAGPANNGTTTTTLVISFTTNIDGTVEGVACPDGQAAPTAVQVLADQCTGDVAAAAHFDEVVVNGVPDTETFTGLSSNTTYDTHYVIDATVDSGVIGLANQTTASAGAPTFTSGPTETPIADGFTIAGTITCTGTCTVEAVACAPGDAAPTSTEVEAGQCGGGNAALMNASEVWTTGVANDFALTSANKPVRFDVYVSGTDGTTDTAVTSLTDQDRAPRSGFAHAVMASVASTGVCDQDAYFDPDCAIGDVFEYEDDTNESADCNVSMETDGDFVLTPVANGDCDGLRTFEISFEDVSSATDGLFTSPAVGNFTTDDTVYVNNTAPICDPQIEYLVLTEDVAMSAVDLTAFGTCSDANSHAMTYSITGGSLPAGTSLGGTGNKDWSGTPTTENEAGTTVTVTVTDVAGDSTTFEFIVYVVNTWTVPNCDSNTLVECSAEIIAAAPWRADDAGLSVSGYICGTGQPFLSIASQLPVAAGQASAFEVIEVELVAAIVPDLVGMTAEEAIAAIEAICP